MKIAVAVAREGNSWPRVDVAFCVLMISSISFSFTNNISIR